MKQKNANLSNLIKIDGVKDFVMNLNLDNLMSILEKEVEDEPRYRVYDSEYLGDYCFDFELKFKFDYRINFNNCNFFSLYFQISKYKFEYRIPIIENCTKQDILSLTNDQLWKKIVERL